MSPTRVSAYRWYCGLEVSSSTMSAMGQVTASDSESRRAGRRAGSASLAIRSSTVPSVASRQVSMSSHRFHSSKVNASPTSVVTAWP